jgi:DNA-binding transcriptional regulator of glucitol operon
VRGLFTPTRLLIGLVCLVSLIACCGLAYWQWTRFESASGTFQNLGYVLQWPLFGLFPAFMVWRIRKLDRERKAKPVESAPEPVVTVEEPKRVVVHRDDESDDELAAYNRMLAELNARDQRERA